MKIAIDLTSLSDNFSGIERFALNIAKEMIKDNQNEYILIFKNEVYKEFLEEENIEKIIIKGGKKLIFNQIKLPIELNKIKADKFLFLAFPSPVLFRKKGIINTIHDLTCWDYPETMKFLSRNYFKISILNAKKVSEKIITVSEFSKKRIMDKLKYKKVKVIYNGVSEVFLKENNSFEEIEVLKKLGIEKKYIMSLGTLEPRKNLKLLIGAFSELVINNKFEYDLVLVGRKGWKMDNILDQLEDKVKKKIVFTGFVNDQHLPIIYKNTELFIFPSIYEGFGIPPIEAMQMEALVLASDIEVFKEILGESANYFKNDNLKELEKKIIEIVNLSKSEKMELIKKGVENSRKFRWGIESNKIIEEIL